MRRAKTQPIRNKLDLSDRVQVRLVRKRLRLTDDQLTAIVSRIGNSIAAISKEVALQRASSVLQPAETPPAAIIASVTATEIQTEIVTSEPAS